MASYQDQSQAALSSYIPQYDVKAYVGVGLQKQAQYDAGLNRIQGALDSVAGLDIIRPIDKEYLQTKMSELNTQLQGVAGGDFSNQSVVNQAMGMAGKLYKDPTIQSAVVSTANIKALMSDQKNLKDKHPELYNVQNEWYDNKGVQNYLGSQDLNASYNGSKEATRYKDYQKDLNDIIKQVSPETTVELTADGQYQFKSTKSEIINPDVLKNVVESYISAHPEAQNQMMIDGMYQFKDYGATQLEGIAKTHAADQISQIQAFNDDFQKKIDANTGDKDYNDKLKKFIESNHTITDRIQKNVDNYSELIKSGQLDAARVLMFNNNLKSLYGLAYQKKVISEDVKENYNAVNLQKFTFDRLRLQHDLITDGMELGQDGQIYPISPNSPNYASYINSLKGKEKGKGENANGTTGDGQLPLGDITMTGSSTPSDDGFTLTKLQEQKAKYINSAHEGKLDIAEANLRKDYFTGLDQSLSDKEKESAFNTYKLRQYNARRDGMPVDPMYKEYLQATQQDNLDLDGLNRLEKEANEYSLKRNPLTNASPITFDRLTIPGSTQRSITINPGEHPELLTSEKRLVDDVVKEFKNKLGKYTYTDIESVIRNANNPIGKYIVNSVVDKYKNDPNYPTLKALAENNLFANYRKLQGSIEPVINKRIQDTNEYLKNNAKGYNEQWFTFDGKPEQLDYASRLIFNELDQKKGVTDNLEGKPYDMKAHGVKDIVPLRARTDDVTGKTIMLFKVGKGDHVEQITSTSPTALTPYNPNNRLIKYLDQFHATPLSGDGVLTSPSGKLRIQLRTSYQNPNSYKVFVIDGGTPIPIELPNINGGNDPLAAKDPTPILNAIAKLDTEVNPYTKAPYTNDTTGRPYTREEIIYRMTPGRTEQEFKQYMTSKANNQ